jgi:ABC-2 type transport system permease protein
MTQTSSDVRARLGVLGVLVAHELRIIRREPVAPLVMVIFPLITMAFLEPAFRPALVATGYPHANGAEQVVPGEAVMSAFFLVSLVTLGFFSEHAWATWDRLRASGASGIEIIAGKGLPRVAIGVAQLSLLLAAGVLAFGLTIRGDPVALAPVIAAFPICLVALGVCVTALSRTAQQAAAFAYLGMVLFGALGGAFVPFNMLPGWARVLGPATPTYWAMRAMKAVILQGRGLAGTVLPTVVLLAMAVLFAAVAAFRFRLDEPKTGWI